MDVLLNQLKLFADNDDNLLRFQIVTQNVARDSPFGSGGRLASDDNALDLAQTPQCLFSSSVDCEGIGWFLLSDKKKYIFVKKNLLTVLR